MDLQTVTLAGLACIGVVNVVTMWKPNLDSRVKFGIALITAFGILFVPQDFGNIILEKLKLAIEIAFASSGTYKLLSKAGGA
jgi:hypothetical protein